MKKWLLVVAMLIASTSANALEFRTVCNTCVTDGNFLAAAKKEVGNFNGSHTVYVINFETSVAKKYSVYQSVRYNKIGDPIYSLAYDAIPLDAPMASNMVVQKRLKNDYQKFIDTSISIPAEIAPSAYSLVARPYLESQVSQYYFTTSSYGQNAVDYLSLIINIAGKLHGVRLNATVKFSDGTIANFRISGLNHIGELTFDLTDSRDKDGNKLPLDKTYLNNEYKFSGDPGTFQEFIKALDRLDVPVSFGGGSNIGPGGSSSPLKCGFEGKVYKCYFG